jgi:hypothetical protein
VLQTLISKADMLLLLLPGLYSCHWLPQSPQPDPSSNCKADMLLLLLLLLQAVVSSLVSSLVAPRSATRSKNRLQS